MLTIRSSEQATLFPLYHNQKIKYGIQFEEEEELSFCSSSDDAAPASAKKRRKRDLNVAYTTRTYVNQLPIGRSVVPVPVYSF